MSSQESPWVAITGTNGKTTTTALVDHLFRTAGKQSAAAGNIGTALSAVALMEARPERLAVELSSFQLHDCPDLHPTVGILTNLAPDHLDRYSVGSDDVLRGQGAALRERRSVVHLGHES